MTGPNISANPNVSSDYVALETEDQNVVTEDPCARYQAGTAFIHS